MKFLSNKAKDWFIPDRKQKVFAVKPDLVPQWHLEALRAAVDDRVEYALARYFNRPQYPMFKFFEAPLNMPPQRGLKGIILNT